MKSGLRVLRAKKNISQEELATALGVEQYQISNLENLKVKRIDKDLIEKIAQFFKITDMREILYFEIDNQLAS